MKNSTFTKFTISAFLFFSFLFLPFLSAPAYSQSAIVDRQDEFFLALPFPGQSVRGKQKVVWKMVDGDQGKVPFEINLLDANCVLKVGTVTSDINIEGNSGFYVYDWDSLGALLNAPAPADGPYCVEAKVTLLNGATPYVVSSKSKISLRNEKNHKPEITSELPKLNLREAEQFSYQVKAVDDDNDTLKYVLLSSPGWLTIDSSSGLMTGEADDVGVYRIILAVEDGSGGVSHQIFSMNVNPKPAADGAVNTPSVLTFTTSVTTIMSGQSNKILWQADDSDGIEKQVLEYSNNGVSWVLISQLDGSNKEANWDVRVLPNGEYFLRLSVNDASRESIKNQLVSKKFIVANDPGLQVESSSSLYNLSPLRNSNVENNLTEVSANFLVGDKKVKVESVQIFLDGIEITRDCTVDAGGFVCKINSNLEPGLHKVKVVYEGEGGGQMEEDWNFSVAGAVDVPDSPSGPETAINTNSIIIIVGVACIVLLLLIVPWAIYLIWTKRRKDEFEEDEGSKEETPPGVPAAGPASEYATPEVYMPSPAPPPSEPPATTAGTRDEYAVGKQELGDLSNEFNVTEIEGTQQPTWLTQEQDIDVSEASRPVTAEGEKAPIPEIEEESNITQPHGMEPVPEDNGQ